MPEAATVEEETEDEYADIDQSEDFLDSDKEEVLEAEEEEKKEEKYTDEEKRQYGRNVKRRIDKEVGMRKELEDKNYILSNRLSELEAKFEHQNASNHSDNIDTRMTDLKKKRVAMYESGDIDPTTEDEWQDLRREKREAEYRKAQVNNEKPQPQQAQEPQRSQAEQNWLDGNDWFDGAINDGDSQKAKDKFAELLEDGYSRDHPMLYKKLDKFMEGDTEEPKQKRESAPPPAKPNGSGNKRPTSKAKLNREDFDMMTEMGMDPRNPEHRKQLLANRRAS